MIEEEDDELEEILRERRRKLLKEISKEASPIKDNRINSDINEASIETYLTEKAKIYLKKKFDGSAKEKILEALYFLVKNRLVEPGIDVEALAYIARRVLGFDYKIYIEDEGEYKEV